MKLTIVTGPPAGGKSTYIRERAQVGDVVIDLDRLALALSVDGTPHHGYPQHISRVAQAARRAAIEAALVVSDEVRVWVIDTIPTAQSLARYRELNAEIVLCDPGLAVTTERARRERPAEVERVVERYYAGTLRGRQAKASPLVW